jgi:hypothetical protein
MTDILEYRPIIDTVDHGLLLKGVKNKYSIQEYPYYDIGIKIWPDLHFCGETTLFLLKSMILEYIDSLEKMHREAKGNITFECQEWGSKIKFGVNKLGAMKISGIIYSTTSMSVQGTLLKFSFKSDQTCLPFLVSTLKEIIS